MSIDTTALGSLIRLSVAAIALYGVWSYMLVPTSNEEFRQRIFELRRELFVLAADGEVEFDSPAYVDARKMMNGLLHFAEVFTFTRMLFSMITGPSNAEELQHHRANMESAPEGVRDRLMYLQVAAFTAALKRSIITSIPAVMVIAMVFAFVHARRLFRGGKMIFRTGKEEVASLFPQDPIVSEAIALGAAA